MTNVRPTPFCLKSIPQGGRAFALVLSLLFFAASAVAQTTTTASDRTTPIGLKPGAPAGSYGLSDLESINLYNGNLTMRLPLLQMSGRGTAGHTVMLALNTKKWNVKYAETETTQTWTPTHSIWGNPYTGYGAGRLEGRKSGFGLKTVTGCIPYPPGIRIFETTFTTLTFRTADGTEYDLRDELSGGQRLSVGSCPQFPYTGQSRGRVFISADGTAATFTSDTDIYDKVDIPAGQRTFTPSGYLVLRDGTRYRIDSGEVSWIRDRNGNKVTFGAGITDSLGRSTTFDNVTDPTYGLSDRIHYKGSGGADRTIYVTWTTLGNALRADQTLKTRAQLFPQLNGASSSGSYDPTVVSSVVLPDGTSYQFRYNSYGELARVVLPTGGAIEYDMNAGSGVITGSNGQYEAKEIYRRVAERRTYTDGANASTLTNRTVYTPPSGTVYSVKVEQFDGSGTLLTSSKHYFSGDPVSTLIGEMDWQGPVQTYPDHLEGREIATEVYNTNGVSATTLLQTVSNTWEAGTTLGGFSINARLSSVYTTLHDLNLVSKKTFSYDQCASCNTYFNNQTDVYEYDYGSGAAGALKRRSHTDYLVTNPVNGVDYTRHDNNIHLRSLPSQQSVYDAGGTEKARTTFEYDNYANDSSHAPLTDRSNMSGFDPAFTISYLTRGNLTKATSWILSTSTPLSAHLQYDVAGSVVKSIDARGYATIFDFTDRFGTPDGEARSNPGPTALAGQSSYGFASLVTNALGQTAYTQFDYYLGRAVDGEDSNAVVSSAYSVNDSLDRPTKVIRGFNTSAQNQTVFTYDDAGKTVTTASDLTNSGDGALISKVQYDGLGRTVRAFTYENQEPGNPWLTSDTQFDALGRAWRTSNPYRSTGPGSTVNPSDLWTKTIFDALGRMISVTTPDNAVVGSSYIGNMVTVTDQALKKRKSVTDGLGRLKEVYEDPTGPLNYQTVYGYDELDNLTTVTQGVQTRSFAYDSLRRLSSATNPESGTINYLYDNNGNLSVKTDARGVSSHYEYDALNRAKRRWYNGSNSITATGHNNPTLPTGVGASDEVKYFYDSDTIPSAPSFDRGYATGRLVAATYGGGSSGTYYGYDALGRSLRSIQQTGGINYQTSATYNKAGGVLTQTYPSSRVVTNTYDAAGRTASVAGTLSDGTNRTYATGILYSPFGGIEREQFGTDTAIYNKLQYNIRGQLWDVRVSAGSDPNGTWNRGVLQFFYDQAHTFGGSNPDNNGNVTQAKHYRPLDDSSATWAISTDTYSYDQLNRITSVSESFVSNTQAEAQQFVQGYVYDRYGNRTIDPATWGTGINNKQFTVSTTNNRLTVPGGQSGMSYDAAGNLTTDTYSAAGVTRAYDAENRMTSETQSAGPAGSYIYNAHGQRVRRTASGVEKWQVYGLGGELVAEYPVNGPTTTPEKEYGYRNGQLLVTAEASAQIKWLVADNLGTPRIIIDKSGTLANVKRHDYLPFGEELLAGQGGRSLLNGHSGDNIRQKFTQKERDNETGLDYFGARYYASTQGRFTSPDLPFMDQSELNPQSWNLYSYVRNNPLMLIDPTGNSAEQKCGEFCQESKRKAEELRKQAEAEGTQVVVINMEPPAVIEVILVSEPPFNLRRFEFEPGIPASGGLRFAQRIRWSSLFSRLFRRPGVVSTTELVPTQGLMKSRRAFQSFKADVSEKGVQESIKYVIYNGEKYVVDGHHRLRAARELGISEVPAEQVSLPYKGYKTIADLFF